MKQSAQQSAPTIVGIDFETSGTVAYSACAVGLARLKNGVIIDTLYSLLRPPSSRVMFTDVHGLTWAMLKNQPKFAEFWPQMRAFLESATGLVAHNAPFDRRVLRGCCEEFACDLPDIPFLCTLKGARRALGLPQNRLSDVCAHFGIELTHHHAGSDAQAAALIYAELRRLGLESALMRLA